MKNYRFKLSQKAIEALDDYIPPHMHGTVIRYFDEHLPPGHFLTAVLAGDLFEAIARGDEHNVRALKGYSVWLYNFCPGRPNGWGSYEAVEAWLAEEPVEDQEPVEVV
jgi:hypothetical protein